MKKKFDFERFRADRNAALLSMDKQKILFYMKKYGIDCPVYNDEGFWRAVHKAVLQVTDFTQEQHKRSYDWLIEHGSHIPVYACYKTEGELDG